MGIAEVNGTMDLVKKDIVTLTRDIGGIVTKLAGKLSLVSEIAQRADVKAMMDEINGYTDDQSEYYVDPLTSVHQFNIEDLALVIAQFQALEARTQATVDAYNA